MGEIPIRRYRLGTRELRVALIIDWRGPSQQGFLCFPLVFFTNGKPKNENLCVGNGHPIRYHEASQMRASVTNGRNGWFVNNQLYETDPLTIRGGKLCSQESLL